MTVSHLIVKPKAFHPKISQSAILAPYIAKTDTTTATPSEPLRCNPVAGGGAAEFFELPGVVWASVGLTEAVR